MIVHQDQRRGDELERAVDHLAGADRRVTAAGSLFRLSWTLADPAPDKISLHFRLESRVGFREPPRLFHLTPYDIRLMGQKSEVHRGSRWG